MADVNAQDFLKRATRLGLVSKEQAEEARLSAEDASLDALIRSLIRREFLTKWQADRLRKGETSGYFLGGCKVLFHVAEGSFARVYRGSRVLGNQAVAVKVLRNRFAADRAAVQQFFQEAEAGMRLIHPNIARTYEYGESEDKYFIIMEFVEGLNLSDFLKTHGRLSEADALPLMFGLADALRSALELGVTHRDLKPTNVLMGGAGVPKLVDFGLGTVEVSDRKGDTGHAQRTVDYSALERTCGSPKGDPRSDIFFLGCLYYNVISGRLPIPEVEAKDPLAKMLRRGINSIRPLSDLPEAPSPELTRIIEKMMKVDLRARYQSMAEVANDLRIHRSRFVGEAAAAPKFDVSELLAAVPDRRREGTPEFPSILAPPSEKRKVVLCVEAKDEIRDAFRRAFARLGVKAVLLSDPENAADRHAELKPDALLMDLDGLGREGIEALETMYEQARSEDRAFPSLVILARKHGDLAPKFESRPHTRVLVKPLMMRDVQESIEAMLAVESD